ncbi:MAG: ATP-binding protein [Bacteroidales bacterium]|nr:ATP-binding protein [Bacteroidales bacterium]
MRIIVENQRKERDRLLSLPYINRDLNISGDDLLSTKQIKLISGPRRAGKSTQALLLLKDKNFAYLNFDDTKLLTQWDEDLVMAVLNEVYPDYEYLLLDEVQNIKDWDLWVSKLYRNGVNLIITGSNAKMLSSEMATVLTGRYIQIEMLPFSLNEIIRWHEKKDNHNYSLIVDDYLKNGGYPETLEARRLTTNYLSTLFDSIIWKDIAQRHKVRNIEDLNNIAMYLLSNFCNPISYNNVADDLGLSSVNTVKKFMAYLCEPYLMFYLSRYNNKLKLMKKSPQKVYVVDNGFVSAKAFNISENLGRLLENQVFTELIRRGYDTEKSLFYYHSRNDKEIDFVCRNGSKIESLIQVCYDMSSSKTENREVNSIIECAKELNCNHLQIITFNEEKTIEKDGYKIEVVPISRF